MTDTALTVLIWLAVGWLALGAVGICLALDRMRRDRRR